MADQAKRSSARQSHSKPYAGYAGRPDQKPDVDMNRRRPSALRYSTRKHARHATSRLTTVRLQIESNRTQ